MPIPSQPNNYIHSSFFIRHNCNPSSLVQNFLTCFNLVFFLLWLRTVESMTGVNITQKLSATHWHPLGNSCVHLLTTAACDDHDAWKQVLHMERETLCELPVMTGKVMLRSHCLTISKFLKILCPVCNFDWLIPFCSCYFNILPLQ